MFIDNFKKEDGYYDQYECYYEDAESFIVTSILGFCGCGLPNAVLEYVYKSLQIVSDLTQLVGEKKLTYEKWKKSKNNHFTNEGAEYFMWYFLNSKELTGHGGSVPGWLTKKVLNYLLT